jgi:hypothetical protein
MRGAGRPNAFQDGMNRELQMQNEATKTVRAGVVGFISGAASYAYIWLNPRTSNILEWLALCAVAGFVTSLISDANLSMALMGIVTGAFSLNVIHIGTDAAADPTSHNLFPFELAFTLLVTTSGAAIGIALEKLAKRTIAYRRVSL